MGNHNSKLILIDTDLALGEFGKDVDDGLALIMALNSPELEIGAVTGVYGNTRWENVYHHLKHLRQLFPVKKQFPIWMGAHGPQDFREKKRLPGIDQMARFIREHPNDVTLVGIGPLTNLALLLYHHSDVIPLLKELVIMGGKLNSFEFNFGSDGPATDAVLLAPIPKFIAGLEVCTAQRFTTAHYARLRARNTPRTRYLLQGIRKWLWINRLLKAGSRSRGGFFPFDPTAIAYLICPFLFKWIYVPARHIHKYKGPLIWRYGRNWTYIDRIAWETRRVEPWWSRWGWRINSSEFLDLLIERLY